MSLLVKEYVQEPLLNEESIYIYDLEFHYHLQVSC